MENDPELKIRVSYDPKARTVTVTDNGIGMSRDEVIANIGTIAKSGTREFLTSLTGDQQKDANLIGQFGVGFYSSFVVADKVTVVTRRAGLTKEHGVRWESDGGGEYTLEVVEKESRGTEVTLHLRDGEDELANGNRLRGIIRKYLRPHHAADRDEGRGMGQRQFALPHHGKGSKPSTRRARCGRARKTTSPKNSTMSFTSMWRTTSKRPWFTLTTRSKAARNTRSCLYIPARAPFDLWDRDHRRGIKLYVRRVFIMDDAEQLLPTYLRFVRGVIDSGRPAAQRVARNPAGIERHPGYPRPPTSSACCR